MPPSTLTFTLGNPNPKLQNSQPRWSDGTNNRAINRKVLRESFGNGGYRKTTGETDYPLAGKSYSNSGVGSTKNFAITPFRMAMNAGDIAGTTNKPVDKTALPQPSNQVHVKGSSLSGYKMFAGSVQTVANGSQYSGNPKYVYDGGDYVRFKKLQAINKNYRDPTFGGDQHNASQ